MAPSSRGPDPSVARDVTAFGDFPDRPQCPDSSVTDVTALLCCPPPPDLRSTMTTVRLHTPASPPPSSARPFWQAAPRRPPPPPTGPRSTACRPARSSPASPVSTRRSSSVCWTTSTSRMCASWSRPPTEPPRTSRSPRGTSIRTRRWPPPSRPPSSTRRWPTRGSSTPPRSSRPQPCPRATTTRSTSTARASWPSVPTSTRRAPSPPMRTRTTSPMTNGPATPRGTSRRTRIRPTSPTSPPTARVLRPR